MNSRQKDPKDAVPPRECIDKIPGEKSGVNLAETITGTRKRTHAMNCNFCSKLSWLSFLSKDQLVKTVFNLFKIRLNMLVMHRYVLRKVS